MAVILGGHTMIKFYENNGLQDEMPGNLAVFAKYTKRKNWFIYGLHCLNILQKLLKI